MRTAGAVLCALLCATGARADELKHPAQGKHVVVLGKKLWVEELGPRDGDPIVVIAGGPGCAHGYFHPHLDVLAQKHRIIYFDALGRGQSERAKNASDYRFQRDVDELEALRKTLKLGTITIYGHSYGGLVAQAYAVQFPANVRKLILANTLYNAEMWQANNDNYNLTIRNQLPETWAKIEALRARGLRSSDKEHQDAYVIPVGILYFADASNAKKAIFECNNDVYYALVGVDGDFIIGGDMGTLDFRAQLKTLKMPTLILNGRYDRVALPRFSVKFKDYAPQAEVVMFEESGHQPSIEEPARFLDVVETFLAK